MTTQQKFFQDILYFNAVGYAAIDNIVGDLNKNIGISANYVTLAEQIIGNAVTENYDLLTLFGNYISNLQSDNTEQLQQALQNVKVGVINTQAYPSFPVCTHISTSILNYSSNMSSAFLSGQIYYFSSVGLYKTSVICIPFNFNLSGNQYTSYLMDTPLDFAVYGIDNFTGVSYTDSNLIKFDYSWSSINNVNNLLIKLNFITSTITNYYLAFYWGSISSSFISTSYVISYPIYYMGTPNFINNLGIYTTSFTTLSTLNNFSGRNNFWSNQVTYQLSFNPSAFVDSNPYLWAPDRLNANLIDGTQSSYSIPLRYPVINNTSVNGLTTTKDNYLVVYVDLDTGNASNQNVSANLDLLIAYSYNYHQDCNLLSLNKKYYNQVPVGFFEFIKNPKKTGLSVGNGYSLYNYNQQVPSFTKVIQDYNLFNNFYQSMILAKTYFGQFNKLTNNYLSALDNFFADYFFGTNFNSVQSYFSDPYLQVSKNTLKEFTQPYGTQTTDAMSFTQAEEESLYTSTNIIPSKQYLNFNQGQLLLNNDFPLPTDYYFEIYKPISVVCNGIDPYNQGTGLAFDYTINLTFSYSNQNTLNKTLYLMASKYLVSKSEYQYMIQNNQDVTGYYWLADPNSTDYNSYSVGSINEFRLYGYAGYIPDLSDGVVRPILTRAFSPSDSTKYTYDQYVQYLKSQGITDPDAINDAIQAYLDAGNTFYTINLNSFSDQFVSLNSVSLCMANYEINTPKYWNDQFILNTRQGIAVDGEGNGFLNLNAVILSGIVSSLAAPGYMITNIPVGYGCQISSVTVNNLGNGLAPGTYTTYVLPPSNQLSNEQPGKIQYSILNVGILDPSSIVVSNAGGNFYFDFNLTLTQPGFTTSLETSYPSVHINMDNLARFTATVSNTYILTSFQQTSLPQMGYNQGFILNPLCFVGLGYTTNNLNVNILINNYPTVDSFLIANNGLTVGTLENTANFKNANNNFSQINYINGTQTFLLFDQELFNTITVTQGGSISYISILCKLILLNSANPAGNIQANIYTDSFGVKTLVASSDTIHVSLLSNQNYSTVILPINYTFSDNQQFSFNDNLNKSTYWVSIQQNLQNCALSLQGSYQGITTSVYSISSSVIYNDVNSFNVYGGIGTFAPDLDLGFTTVNINSQLFGIASTVLGLSTNFVNVFIRRDVSYIGTQNQVYLTVNAIQNGLSTVINSNPISVVSIGTTYTVNQFVFSSSISSDTMIVSSNFNFTNPLGTNKMYLARSLKQYDVTSVGFATSSQLSIGGISYNFDFVFNKIFSQVSNQIYGAFNLTNASQFGLANPNTLRQNVPLNIIDGYWSFNSQNVYGPLAVYPRAFYSNSSVIGTSLPTYQYLGYTHNIYLNIGYNSSGIYKQELVTLNAQPLWQSTWMYRDLTSYKNFTNYNILQQTFLNSIYYHVGLGSTNINNNFGPKSAIFQGTFTPPGNLLQPISLIIGYGTNSGVQVYLNNSTQAIIDTFSVISTSFSTVSASIGTAIRSSSIFFKIYYFTLSTASLEVYWNVGLGQSLINAANSNSSGTNTPYILNSGKPIDNIVFMNISKTLSDANSVNSGFPPGDSFIIRSS
jgi:hypothetical protein